MKSKWKGYIHEGKWGRGSLMADGRSRGKGYPSIDDDLPCLMYKGDRGKEARELLTTVDTVPLRAC